MIRLLRQIGREEKRARLLRQNWSSEQARSSKASLLYQEARMCGALCKWRLKSPEPEPVTKDMEQTRPVTLARSFAGTRLESRRQT
jgi:hypothetical protein